MNNISSFNITQSTYAYDTLSHGNMWMIYQPSVEKPCVLCTLEGSGYNIQLKYLYFKNSDIHILGTNNKIA